MTMNVKKHHILGAAVCFAGASLLAGGLLTADPTATTPEPIADVLCLRKMALDLTYRGPTEAEVADLEAGTKTLGQMADVYLASSDFEQVVFDWHRSQYPPTELTIEGVDVEEPSRIARHLVVNDLDYRQLVNGDFTIAADGSEQTASNGPTAGILSTQHYMNAFSGSYRRNWAGHFLAEWTPIVLRAVTLPDDDDTDLSPGSLMTNPACASCHASEIFGIDFIGPFALCYSDDGLYQDGCDEPGGKFLTVDGANIADLGNILADSNEFMANTVNFYFTKLFGRSMAYEEREFYVDQVTAFRNSEYKAKSLIKSMVTSSHYCAR